MRRTPHSLLTVLIVLTWCPFLLQAQEFPFQSYVVRDGLPSNYVTALCQDSRGYLWIGTDNGVSVYDGTEFKNFTTTDGLPNLFITEIHEQRYKHGSLWIGTIAGGLVRFEDGAFFNIPVGDNSIGALYEDTRGTLWCSTREHIYTVRDDSAVVCEDIPGGEYDIQSMGDSVIVFLGRREILYYHLTTRNVRKQPLVLAKNEVVSPIHVDNDGSIWIVTSARRFARVTRDGVSFHQLTTMDVLSENLLPLDIIDDGRGKLWVILPHGILQIDKLTYTCTLIRDVGKPHTVLSGSSFLDREENLWLGTTGEGLLKLADQRIISIPLEQVSTGAFNLVATSDTNGHIWVSTLAGLWEIYRTNSGEWRKHRQSARPTESGILIDPLGRMWDREFAKNQYRFCDIGRQEGGPSTLRVIGSISAASFEAGIQGYTFAVDPGNHAWLTFQPPGLIEFDIDTRKIVRRFTPSNGLLDDELRALLADQKGNIWSGTWTAGLNILPPGADTFRTVQEFPGLAGSGVRSLHEDREGSLWVGTRYNGLLRHQNGKVTELSVKDGLLSNAIWCIAETDQRLWCGTDVGLESIDKATGKVFPQKNELIGRRVFACGAYRSEYVWAVLENSIMIFHHPEARPRGVPPPVYIKSLSVNGTPIPPGSPHEFSHDQNSYLIEFVGLGFKDERRVRYRYRMLGLDSIWTHPLRQPSVSFASLPPGSYTFEVHAINSDGISSTTPASIQFVIVPPIWRRWWFVALAMVAVAFILYLLYRYRVARLLEMERLRTRIAADLHDDVGTNLSSIILASQIIERELPLHSEGREHLSELRSRAGMTQEMLKDVVWLLNPRNDTMGDFILKLREIARRQLMTIQCTFNISGEQRVEGLSLEFKRNAILFFKEAVTNVAKHAEATAVTVDIALADAMFTLTIRDNGKGFSTLDDSAGAGEKETLPRHGNGLTNLRVRAQHMGGSAEIASTPGHGTTVRLVSTIAYTRSIARRKKSIH